MELVFLDYTTGWRSAAELTCERLDALRLPAADPMVPIWQLLRCLIHLQLGKDTSRLPPFRDAAAAAVRVDTDSLWSQLLIAGACLAAGESTQIYEVIGALVARMRNAGAVGLLPRALSCLAALHVHVGRHRDARTTADEAIRIARDTDQHELVSQASTILAVLAAYAGDEEECLAQAQTAIAASGLQSTSPGIAGAYWSLSILDLGLGRPEAALTRLEAFYQGTVGFHLGVVRTAPDVIEAAVRVGEPHRAARAYSQYEQWAAHAQQPWIDAILLRCRALLASDDEAERHYAAAVAIREPDRPFEYARTALLYGEWLRRTRRRSDARVQLRAALEIFDRFGAHPWAERARTELRAAGETVAIARPPELVDQLTPQELHVIRLAADGLSNRAIGAQLFLSPRTVGYHLYKAFPKLGITSRVELARLQLGEA